MPFQEVPLFSNGGGGCSYAQSRSFHNNQPSQGSKSGTGFSKSSKNLQPPTIPTSTTGTIRKLMQRKLVTCSSTDTNIFYKKFVEKPFQTENPKQIIMSQEEKVLVEHEIEELFEEGCNQTNEPLSKLIFK